jgi:hypothetical protein
MASSETGSTAVSLLSPLSSPMDIYEGDGDCTDLEKGLSSAEDVSVVFS